MWQCLFFIVERKHDSPESGHPNVDELVQVCNDLWAYVSLALIQVWKTTKVAVPDLTRVFVGKNGARWPVEAFRSVRNCRESSSTRDRGWPVGSSTVARCHMVYNCVNIDPYANGVAAFYHFLERSLVSGSRHQFVGDWLIPFPPRSAADDKVLVRWWNLDWVCNE